MRAALVLALAALCVAGAVAQCNPETLQSAEGGCEPLFPRSRKLAQAAAAKPEPAAKPAAAPAAKPPPAAKATAAKPAPAPAAKPATAPAAKPAPAAKATAAKPAPAAKAPAPKAPAQKPAASQQEPALRPEAGALGAPATGTAPWQAAAAAAAEASAVEVAGRRSRLDFHDKGQGKFEAVGERVDSLVGGVGTWFSEVGHAINPFKNVKIEVEVDHRRVKRDRHGRHAEADQA
ncbi:hypothetical protein HT031_006438 [Scenedesmus sp. PABB004]|nr:hypothetical protein HT031_006438 [Scenedesmus sp. PABB004]